MMSALTKEYLKIKILLSATLWLKEIF